MCTLLWQCVTALVAAITVTTSRCHAWGSLQAVFFVCDVRAWCASLSKASCNYGNNFVENVMKPNFIEVFQFIRLCCFLFFGAFFIAVKEQFSINYGVLSPWKNSRIIFLFGHLSCTVCATVYAGNKTLLSRGYFQLILTESFKQKWDVPRMKIQ